MNDEEILQAVLCGDEAVFNGLVQQYSKLLWVVAYSMLGKNHPQEDVEELVSDVFVRFWKHPRKYEPERGSLKNYLALMTRSLALNKTKLRQTLEFDDTCELEALTVDRHDRALIWDIFFDGLDLLKDPTREICLQRFFYERKPEAISQLLGVSKMEVNNRLYKGKKKLQQYMKKQIEEELCYEEELS